jgi:C1A family cysteine protease
MIYYSVKVSITAVFLAASGLLASDPSVPDPVPSIAPMNPDFVNYMERLQREGETPLFSQGENAFGYIPSPIDYSHLRADYPQIQALSLPSAFDLRQDRVTSVKNQGNYGTCWAHAAMASLESCVLSSTGENIDFSENNLLNLNGFDWNTWGGGNASIALSYFNRWNGPVLEADDPYPYPNESTNIPPARHLVNLKFLPPRTGPTDNMIIKQAITNFGAVHANYYHDVTYTTYYNSNTSSYYYPGGASSDGPNHAIALVGWDDAYPGSNFLHTPPGNGAFIVKNSWGTWWGEDGYFYISYYDIRLGYHELALFYDAIPTKTYRKIYQYDPLGAVGNAGSGTGPTYWGANIFTATGNDIIGAVGFYAEARNTTNTISIYKNVNVGQPKSGTLATNMTVSSTEAGYVTVLLPTPVFVPTNTRFSIVMKLTTPGYNYPLAYEYPKSGYTSTASASAGQSYMSSGGSSWTDMTTRYANANFCAKAYVFNEVPVITGGNVISVSGAPNFQIAYTGIKGITNRVQRKVSLTNLVWSSIRTNVPSYTGIQTNQIPIQTDAGFYRISLP